jgi:hypothetical protein
VRDLNDGVIMAESNSSDVGKIKERVNSRAIRVKIRALEKELFALKLQYSKMTRPVSGKIIIEPPSEYNCRTCYNEKCEFHVKYEPTSLSKLVKGITLLKGCLEWLPMK